MTGYTKLFSSILTSSIWSEDNETRIVWITMLALADQHGEINATIPGLSRLSGVPIPAVEAALAKFQSPDPYSRTPDFEGRRIEKCDGGWVLLNFPKYRESRDSENRRDQVRQAVRRHRSKQAGDYGNQCNPCNHDVIQGNPLKAQAEAEAINPCSPLAGDEKKERLRLEIGGWFNRRPNTKWSDRELRALDKVMDGLADEDLALMRKRYTSGDKYLRKDILTLLNNWQGELDRARQMGFFDPQPPAAYRPPMGQSKITGPLLEQNPEPADFSKIEEVVAEADGGAR